MSKTPLTPEAIALASLVFRRRRASQFGGNSAFGAIQKNLPQSVEALRHAIQTGVLRASKDSKEVLRDLLAPKRGRRVVDGAKWRRLRYDALSKADGKCVCCGRGAKDGAALHVDHIKPVSKYPELMYEPSNLQVLCADCNLGKLNRDSKDWR